MKLKPWQWILLAMIAAFATGAIINSTCVVEQDPDLVFNSVGTSLISLFDYIGTIFMNLLKMVIVPLVFTSIVVGIAGLGKTDGFARLGMKTLVFYMVSSFVAILIGLFMVNTFQPGLQDGKPNETIRKQIESNEDRYAGAVKGKLAGQGGDMNAVKELFLRMIPQNVFEAFGANNKMLSLIFVSLLTGIGLIFISGEGRTPVLNFFQGLNELTLLITHWVMWLAPIGVFGLVAETTAQTGLEIVLLLGKYFLVVIAALLTHMLVVMPLVLRYVAKVHPRKHFYAMRNAILTAFSTASSSATLPVSMEAVRDNAGVSERVTSFVLPLGATVNMDGTALYECVAVMFVAQVLGIDLTFGTQFTVVMLALLTSIGVAGVPSASLVAITIIVYNVGIPNAEAVIGLILAVDRPLDMTRTAVNVFSDSCAAIVVARTEGEPLFAEEPIVKVPLPKS
ncbi:MAG: dicarboxylate/amino acid:cation symporter [Verrucomicrobiales bacterium]|nr:dicarboxylate/amino acid:cation symporter [Verrucomicrobiales bacterium]